MDVWCVHVDLAVPGRVNGRVPVCFLTAMSPYLDRCLGIFWCAVRVCVRVQIHVYIPFKETLSNVF